MPTKPRLKIGFTDFWFGFDPERNFFHDCLSQRFEVEISSSPDILICSTFGMQWKEFEGPRVFFTGENLVPDPRFFDASLSFQSTEGTNCYFPLYRIYGDYPACFQERTASFEDWKQKKSIATVVSNAAANFRVRIFQKLSRDIGVDSGGRAFNNVGGPVAHKVTFLRNYKCSLAFENTSVPGYTTEKLIESYAAGTVPIYWGDPLAGSVFNKASFLSIRDGADYRRLLGETRRILDDFDAYKSVYEQPLFPNNEEPDFLRESRFVDFFEKVVSRGLTRKSTRPVSRFEAYQWRSQWRFRGWSQRQRVWIPFVGPFVWVGYWGSLAKSFVGRLLRKG
jgi:hypothetical protein